MKASLRDTVGNKADCPILVFSFYFKMFLSAREAVAADSSACVFEDNCVVVGNERTVHLVPLVGGGLNAMGNAIGYSDTLLAKAVTLTVQKEPRKQIELLSGLLLRYIFRDERRNTIG